MVEEYDRHSPHSQLILQGMLQHTVLAIYEEKLPYKEASMELHAYDERIHKAFVYVKKNLAFSPSLSEVAAHVCPSVKWPCALDFPMETICAMCLKTGFIYLQPAFAKKIR